MQNFENKRILLIISGGVAAYKALELIRLIKKQKGQLRAILTQGGSQFITPLSISSLTGEQTYTDLWSLKDETEMGHIRLSREADLIVIAPASANMIAKMAHGLADDLASTTLLASDKPVLIAPAMNQQMWAHPATQDNLKKLKERGVLQIGPNPGEMACGEEGLGRMAEPEEILGAIQSFFFERPLKGYKALVTAGPTFEPIDPVRFIGNRSSGKQGYAIAEALRDAGADVTLVSGPTALPAPAGMNIVNVQSAAEMLKACEAALPVDIAVCAAAVADWTPSTPQTHKIKKRKDESAPVLQLKENPDILKTISNHKKRPKLVIGFAAETENLIENAKAKLKSKSCDWILANDVSGDTFGGEENHLYLITRSGSEDWKRRSKKDMARTLVNKITNFFKNTSQQQAAE
ncbi:MAG: bifunctional phosphopantothenoylcysteine decarboxylase/phosphopantothenate--cysteine ligase CoaBC [Alphaproteobacteria bacterium]|nr:bifunctional phosphopantothenoylcysteine decarboxylase/phosphopantothenate--cysteine ligase CoaBC [Alphaproteobacteria bacterium]